MLPKAPPTTSNLNLVTSDFSDSTEVRDVQDGVQMAELVESLDTRELDIGDGEDLDYDANSLGVWPDVATCSAVLAQASR